MRLRNLILTIAVFSGVAFAQGGHVDLPAIFSQSSSPMQIAGLNVIVCSSTATVTSGQCSPTVSTFSDQALTQPIANLQTNGDGLFPFWISPGNYQYCLSGSPIVSFCSPFTVGVAPGSSPSFASLTLTQDLILAETTAPTCAAGFDCLYGDSSLHRPRFINNAGAAVSIALLSDPLTAFTGTFTSAQLAALITDETGTGAAVFATGSVIAPTSVTTGQIIQPAATALTIKDNQGGTRFSIPSGGVAQSTLNNTVIGGGSTYNGTTQNFQKFAASGTFTIPVGVTSVKVTDLAAGGAGAGSTASNSGGGGGSGGNTIKYLTGLTPGNTLTVTVGAGGTGVSGAGGNAGGNSTVASGTQTITSIIANGGGGGSVTAGFGVGGAGGAAGSGGDENNAGTPGAIGIASISIGGSGAPSIRGGGASATGNAGGNVGTSPGSGGGGSGAGGTNTGGTGATGEVVFEWTT